MDGQRRARRRNIRGGAPTAAQQRREQRGGGGHPEAQVQHTAAATRQQRDKGTWRRETYVGEMRNPQRWEARDREVIGADDGNVQRSA